MKTIYLGEKEAKLRSVYVTEETVYTKEDILKNPNEFQDTEYIFSTWGMPLFTEQEIKTYFPNLKALFYGAGSVQSFARPFLNCNVKVFSAWAANAIPVAEYTVAQILLANKGFFKTMRFQNKKEAKSIVKRFPGNYNAKVGIIGAGMIGKLVIQMLKKHHLRVLVFDPFLPAKTAAELGVETCSLERIFKECHVVSNHLANNDQTKGMLGGKLFSSMLPYATFINTGRGAQVVEEDLRCALKARPDLTALLDVTFPEPPVEGSDLYTLENCILTPHIAGSEGNEVQRMGLFMKEEYENLIQSRPCKYEVSLKMLETMA